MKRIIASITFCLLILFLLFGNFSRHPFDYDLHLLTLPGKNSRTLISFHGYGGNYEIAHHLKNTGIVESNLISFNFPDHDIEDQTFNPSKVTLGSIQELLPALYVVKQHVIDKGLTEIDLHGFSAGGAALVNLLAVLNTATYDAELAKIGIRAKEKIRILSAIQKGVVVLDTPLKSLEEIIAYRGTCAEMDIMAERYRKNNFRPIDSLERLKGLSLDVIVHFQDPDETLFNRDDALYIERLMKANELGTTTVLIENDGGHSAPHLSLWKLYSRVAKKSRSYTNVNS